ncbi:MAG: cyclic nucleotide-binding domain-containing protein [Cocleimonas sp.]
MTAIASDELVKQVVKACPKFCEALTTEEVSTFVKFTKLVEASPNQIIADIGEVGEEFYLVLEGRIRLINDEAGKEMDVGRIESGCLAGEMSFFDRQPRSIRLRAGKKNGVKLLAISRPMYKRLCVENSYISVNLLEFVVMSLDKLIRNSSKDMATMYKHVAGVGYR